MSDTPGRHSAPDLPSSSRVRDVADRIDPRAVVVARMASASSDPSGTSAGQAPSGAPRASSVRHEIQALRLVAVTLVVLEHVLGRPVGGFVGVDVFFVISGYLICGHLLREAKASGRVSLVSFVRRRVRRLLPAASLVLGATVVAAWLVFPSGRFRATALDALWSAGLAANFRFASSGTGYFDRDAPPSPLQHFWSLAVEEQFYLAVPLATALLVAVLARRGRGDTLTRWFGVGLAVIVAASFGWALVESVASPHAAYFSTATRAWELGVGALLAVVAPRMPVVGDAVRITLGIVGLGVVVGSAFVLTPETVLPAPGAVVPVLAAALVIAVSRAAPRSGIGLATWGPGGFVADASYSIYLWHYPVLVFAAALTPTADDAVRGAVVLGVALAVGAASYLLVERPVLRSPWLMPRAPGAPPRGEAWRRWRSDVARTYRDGGLAVLAALCVVMILVTVLDGRSTRGVATADARGDVVSDSGDEAADASPVESAGPASDALAAEITAALQATSWPELSPSLDDLLAANSALDATATADERRLLDCGSSSGRRPSRAECTIGPADAPSRAVLLGDSMAAFSFPAYAEIARPASGWSIENASQFSCPFAAVDFDLGGAGDCKGHNEEVRQHLLDERPDRVIVSNHYIDSKDTEGRPVSPTRWREAQLEVLRPLAEAGIEVVFVAPPPSRADVRVCYTRTSVPSDCLTTPLPFYLQRGAVDRALADELGGTWVDTTPLWCVDLRCPAFVGTTPVKFDFDHLTFAMAVKAAPALDEVLTRAGVGF